MNRYSLLSKSLTALIITLSFINYSNAHSAVDAQSEKYDPLSEKAKTYVNFMSDKTLPRPQRVYSDYNIFSNKELLESKGSTTLSQHLGFSGASYKNIKQYESDFLTEVAKQIKKTPKGGTAIVVLGGSVDGMGQGYAVLEKLRTDVKNYLRREQIELKVLGMIAADVTEYHYEGAKQGWGEVISSYQDALLLVDTKDGAWELIATNTPDLGQSRTVDLILSAANMTHINSIDFFVWEGADQALKETTELLVRAKAELDEKQRGKIEVILKTSFQAGIPKKDKGYIAASQIALAVAENQTLETLKVSVNDANMEISKRVSASEFINNTKNGQKIVADTKVNVTETEDVEDESINARNRYYLALKNTYNLIQEVILRHIDASEIKFNYNIREAGRVISWNERYDSYNRIAFEHADHIPIYEALLASIGPDYKSRNLISNNVKNASSCSVQLESINKSKTEKIKDDMKNL